jgi:hypothetical protein
MSRNARWVNVVGLLLGAVALGSTVFSFARLLGNLSGGAGLLPRVAEVVRGVNEGFGRNLRNIRPDIPWVGGWRSAEAEELVRGNQTELIVNNVSGPVRVVAWDQDEIRVHYVKQARTQADLEDFVVDVRSEGSSVTVRPMYTAQGALGRFGSVDIEISVPARVRQLTIHNVSGEIVVGALPGDVQKLLVTVSGAITADGAGNLEARSTSGAVAFTFRGAHLAVSTVSGSVKGTIEALGPDGAELGTVSGSVEIGVRGGLDAALDLRSVSGSIRCDYPTTPVEQTRRRLRATAGGGTVPFEVHTTSGAIRVSQG